MRSRFETPIPDQSLQSTFETADNEAVGCSPFLSDGGLLNSSKARKILGLAIGAVLLLGFQNCGNFAPTQLPSEFVDPLPSAVGIDLTALSGIPMGRTSVVNAKSTVASGGGHACAIVDGALQCWGANDHGQLGDGTKVASSKPKVVISSGVTAVAIGSSHTCAIVGGALQCWGTNGSGQVGDGTSTDVLSPVVVIPSGVTMVAAGTFHTCAVVSGEMKCWGLNSSGQLGTGTTDPSLLPVSNKMSRGVQAISAGAKSTCAIVNDGQLSCWGSNTYGQLGNGTTVSSSSPSILIPGGVRSVSASASTTCAVMTNALACWGDLTLTNTNHSINPLLALSPVVFASGDVKTVSVADQMICALVSETLRCWENATFSSGTNRPTMYTLKSRDVATSGISDVAVGIDFVCVRLNGTPACSGSNVDGRLGRGYLSDPVPFSKNIGFVNVKKVSLGRFQTCALTGDGAVQCAGVAFAVPLGQPYLTLIPSGATDVALNQGYDGCAIVNSALKCWSRSVSESPVTLVDNGVIKFTWAGDSSGWFLKTDGSVWGFSIAYTGSGAYNFSVPQQFIASGAVDVVATFFNTVVLMNDGKVMASKNNQPFAVYVSGAEKIYLGDYRLCMVLVDHVTIKCGYLTNDASTMTTVYTGPIETLAYVRSTIWIVTAAGALVADGAILIPSGVSGEPMNVYDSQVATYRNCAIVNDERRCWGVIESPSMAITTVTSVREQYGAYNACVLHLDDSVSCGGSNAFGESDPILLQRDQTILPISGP